ncbi:MAG: type II secretion system protein J [Candidatus Tectimicrobiota bacterium]
MGNKRGVIHWKPIVYASHWRPSYRAGGNRGFTLVELLVALFLFGMVAGVIFAAFAAITNGVEKGRQSMELYRVGRAALFRMAQEIGAALPANQGTVASATATGITAALTGKKGNGAGAFPQDRIEFVTIPYRYQTLQGGAYESCRIAYYLADNVHGGISLVREEDCSGEESTSRQRATLLEMTDLAVGLGFTYYDAEKDYEEWPPVRGEDSVLPCRVRIALTLGATRHYERSFITVASLPMREPCEQTRGR